MDVTQQPTWQFPPTFFSLVPWNTIFKTIVFIFE